mmetsp:Transcript_19773/g.58849  ORF Transcript_19773/g.58849 Transcript_19773/m.58849 type:complete len:244 (+) Transcript_19773:941-1672(+)
MKRGASSASSPTTSAASTTATAGHSDRSHRAVAASPAQATTCRSRCRCALRRPQRKFCSSTRCAALAKTCTAGGLGRTELFSDSRAEGPSRLHLDARRGNARFDAGQRGALRRASSRRGHSAASMVPGAFSLGPKRSRSNGPPLDARRGSMLSLMMRFHAARCPRARRTRRSRCHGSRAGATPRTAAPLSSALRAARAAPAPARASRQALWQPICCVALFCCRKFAKLAARVRGAVARVWRAV